MCIYRIKLERVVKETVVVLVEAETAVDIFCMDPVVKGSLEDHADNCGSWDGECVSAMVVTETLPCHEGAQGKPVFNVSDPKHLERCFVCCEKQHTVKAYVDPDTAVVCAEVCAACPECGEVHDF